METTTTRSAPPGAPGAAQADDSLRGTRRWALALSVLAGAMVLWALWMVFFYVPTEAEMGVVQRIFYIHVPSAWTAFMAFGLVALCSAGYLWLRDPRLDAIAVSAAELGLLFTTLVLLSEIKRLHPQQFQITNEGFTQMIGSRWAREAFDRGDSPASIWERWEGELRDWERLVGKYRLYGRI